MAAAMLHRPGVAIAQYGEHGAFQGCSHQAHYHVPGRPWKTFRELSLASRRPCAQYIAIKYRVGSPGAHAEISISANALAKTLSENLISRSFWT
jgi:hypothetical protein